MCTILLLIFSCLKKPKYVLFHFQIVYDILDECIFSSSNKTETTLHDFY